MDTHIPHNWKEWRRMQALHLKQTGWHHYEIAKALGVTKGAVSQWMAMVRDGGIRALHSRSSPGPPSKLTLFQMRLIPDFLSHGAEAYGFRGEVWTCRRVADVIKREFGVSYSKSQVSRILKKLGWTPQVPLTRAIQRDEDAIERWRIEVWPHLKNRARRDRRRLIFVDESGFYLLPGVVKTYAPKGVTPIIYEWQTRDHLSVMGGVTPQGKVYTLVRQESLNGLHTVIFLEHLLHMVGKRLLVIWDGSPIHRREEVKDFLSSPQPGTSVHVEALPPYAPDLNPSEGAWRHLKLIEMRNKVYVDLEELHMEIHLAIGRLRRKPHIISSFFSQAGLLL